VICELPNDSLIGRGHKIAEMLSPIVGKRPVAYALLKVRNEILIAVHSGPRPITDYREWRFNTISSAVRGGYFERWIPADENRTKYYLDRSYLHLYWQSERHGDESELMALHCDPNEPEDTGELRHSHYKRGPHVHVIASQQPLPHSHFALNSAHLPQILTSVDTLSEAMCNGVALLRDQVLDVIDAHR
jgi:hypothetical protein